MTTTQPISELDALPLPVSTHCTPYPGPEDIVFTVDQLRADRIAVWDLAMRAQSTPALDPNSSEEWRFAVIVSSDVPETGKAVLNASTVLAIDAEMRRLQALVSQPAQEPPAEIDLLRKALVYVTFALHGTPQHMLADGITLIDGDTVEVKRDGWKVYASVNPLRQEQQQAGAVVELRKALSDLHGGVKQLRDGHWTHWEQSETSAINWLLHEAYKVLKATAGGVA